LRGDFFLDIQDDRSNIERIMKKETTKAALLDIGVRIIAEKGYNHTGIDAVLKAAGVPKGSFYHYFESKEDFGLQVIEYSAAEQDQKLDELLGDATRSPLERFRAYFEMGREHFVGQACRKGCLIGNLGQELADQNETFRLRLEEIFARWNRRFAECLSEARRIGEIPAHYDPLDLAVFCIASYEGALLQAKVQKNVKPIENFIHFVFERLLKMESPIAK
jgi:TetR/AcrR family transcriptional repressor of nem operon